jgi:hypothetical protein
MTWPVSSRHRMLLWLLATMTLVVLAFSWGESQRATLPSTADLSPAGNPTPPTNEVDHSSVRNGVLVGWHHDLAGARSAATSYVQASKLVAGVGPLTRRDVVLTFATPSYGPSLVDATNHQLDDLLFSMGSRQHSPDDLILSEHALTTRTVGVSDDEVEVQVWSVLVVSVEGGVTSRQVWRTSTLRLRWLESDWKVDHWETSSGPVPAPRVDEDASSTSAIQDVTSWLPATERGS